MDVPAGTIQGKVWGDTQRVFASASVIVELCHARAGWRCSTHHHAARANLFHVVSGELVVRALKDGLWDATALSAGQQTTILPGVEHRFEAHQDVTFLEVYFRAPLDAQDIVRRDQGGPLAPYQEGHQGAR